MIFRPVDSSKQIADYYRRYLQTTFVTNRPYYNEQMKQQLADEGVVANGPYISMSDCFEKGCSLSKLVEEKILSKEILKLSSRLPETLYRHQEEAVRKAAAGKNLVVTTGTGSGKTECFLMPVVNELMREKEAGTLDSGIRTLIIYPMNALVNDQIERLRKLFRDYDEKDITFGKYTGETEEKEKNALAKYKEREGKEPEKNELISREKMRENPPHIMITNYAMLEFLLLRPGDNVFFNEQNSKKWKFIVLDEAHTYSGATGIEVSSLIRRVKSMLRRNDIRFLLTSATLGDENDNPRIVNFASQLCQAAFDNDSIVRAYKAEPIFPEKTGDVDFSIYRELSDMLRNNAPSVRILDYLEENGTEVSSGRDVEESVERTLYGLVLHDRFYYRVRKAMLNKTKLLTNLTKELNVKTNDLTDFIAVASAAGYEASRLFEARYHMFLRGMEGVYITLNPSNKLFLKKRELYQDPDGDEYRAFEVSFCANCSALFIVGQTSDDGHLVQKSRYSDEFEPEVYLLEGDYEEIDENDENVDNEFIICSRCGEIVNATSDNGLTCGHGKQFINRLVKVKEKRAVINSCPCCHSFNAQRSIMRPYFLGNESATAVIATALYDALPGKYITREIHREPDYIFGGEDIITETVHEENIVKQFLAFSDSRQAAAFFASYLDNTYRTGLIKRLMTEVKAENEEAMTKGISLSYFVDCLSTLFEKYHVFEAEKCRKEAWKCAIGEMTNYKAKNSMQNEGILCFDVDITKPGSEPLELSGEEMTALSKILCGFFLKAGAVTIPILLNSDDVKELYFGGVKKGFCLEYQKSSYIESWMPADGKDNVRTELLQKIWKDASAEDIRKRLGAFWQLLYKEGFIAFDSTDKKFYLNHGKILVRRVDKLFRCDECTAITPYNLRGVCSKRHCSGHLHDYDVFKLKSDDHYFRMYRDLDLNNLVVKEHTAQLDGDKAYDYQNGFIRKKINVLSCSTTFEMGVDVGSLETVFMRNIPPSPANYAQRAGRAGRSKQSAAYALTYCPNSSHDLHYYNNPVEMINGTISPPVFNIENEKITLRHIFASAFSFFWRKYPELFEGKNIGDFVNANGVVLFRQYLEGKPEDLKEYLKHAITVKMQEYYGVDDFFWTDRLFSEDCFTPGVLTIAMQKYNNEIEELRKAQHQAEADLSQAPDAEKIKYSYKIGDISRSIKTVSSQGLIEFLSKNNLIPKYGFPVDTVDLVSLGESKEYRDLDLNRDLLTAISEYAPDSEVVADGKLIKSRYVRKVAGYNWPEYNFCFCKKCNTLNKCIYTSELPETCKQCGQPLQKRSQGQYIIPKFGFVVDNAEPKEVGTAKPERTYRGSIHYIGDGTRIENCIYELNGKKVVVGTSKMDELAVLNTSAFYICKDCGYGIVSDDENIGKLFIQKKHKKANSDYYCPNDTLPRLSLGHEFQTDVVQIKFVEENITDTNAAWTILYSLIEGLSKTLNIDRSELSGTLQWYRNEDIGGAGNYAFIIFDNTPGGAGYVRQLKETSVFTAMVQEGRRIVDNCDCGGVDAETVCYSCLCNFYNQRQHDIMKRRYAIDFFKSLSNGLGTWLMIKTAEENPASEAEKQGKAARYNYDGTDMSGSDWTKIWNYIMQDTDDQEEIEVFTMLSEIMNKGIEIEKPYYQGTVTVIETNEKIIADYVWPEKKVILLLKGDSASLCAAKESDWTVFCMEEPFAADELKQALI